MKISRSNLSLIGLLASFLGLFLFFLLVRGRFPLRWLPAKTFSYPARMLSSPSSLHRYFIFGCRLASFSWLSS